MTRQLLSRLARRFRKEDGTASIEFVIFVPVVVTLFMASVEAGFYMARHVMMERGLDMVIREVRLGNIPMVNPGILRKKICDATPILGDCMSTLMIEMTPVSTETFAMPAPSATCKNRGVNSEPLVNFTPGGSNEIMFVRICSIQDPIFPSTGVGLKLKADDLGGYQMVASSVYVNEPR